MNKLLILLRGSPWIEAKGERISSTLTRYTYLEPINLKNNEVLQTKTVTRIDGTTVCYTRIMPMPLKLWQDFKDWLRDKLYE